MLLGRSQLKLSALPEFRDVVADHDGHRRCRASSSEMSADHLGQVTQHDFTQDTDLLSDLATMRLLPDGDRNLAQLMDTSRA
jgi:hypothetical protein